MCGFVCTSSLVQTIARWSRPLQYRLRPFRRQPSQHDPRTNLRAESLGNEQGL